ncbi:MAG: hypothetical protein AB1801_24640, partial [Chloroflexota bacterium]
MSVSSIAYSSRRRKPLPSLFIAGIAFGLALAGAAALLVGLLNLDRPSSYALIALGGLVLVGSTVWGVRTVRLATGISAGQQFLTANMILVFVFFYLPILALIVFSFNANKVATTWEGFSFKWYASLVQDEAILRAFRNSLIVTFASTFISTIIGTMVSLAMERYNFRLKLPFDAMLYMPIIIPEIVIALATLLFFIILFNIASNLLGISWGLGLITIT